MQGAIKFTIFLLLSLGAGCEILTPGVESACEACDTNLEIHLNNSFDDDRVRVTLDDEVVFDDRVTTDYIWSLAEIIELQRPAGPHRLEVEINDSYRETKAIGLDQPLYVHVRFYPAPIPAVGIREGIVVDVTDKRPMYD